MDYPVGARRVAVTEGARAAPGDVTSAVYSSNGRSKPTSIRSSRSLARSAVASGGRSIRAQGSSQTPLHAPAADAGPSRLRRPGRPGAAERHPQRRPAASSRTPRSAMRLMSARVRHANSGQSAALTARASAVSSFVTQALSNHDALTLGPHPVVNSPPPPDHSSPLPGLGASHRLQPRSPPPGKAPRSPTARAPPTDPSAFLDEAAELITLHGVSSVAPPVPPPDVLDGAQVDLGREDDLRRRRGRAFLAQQRARRRQAARAAAAASATATSKRTDALAALDAARRSAVAPSTQARRRGSASSDTRRRRRGSGPKAGAASDRSTGRQGRVRRGAAPQGPPPSTVHAPRPAPRHTAAEPDADDLYLQWLGTSQAAAQGTRSTSPDMLGGTVQRSGSPSAVVVEGGVEEAKSPPPTPPSPPAADTAPATPPSDGHLFMQWLGTTPEGVGAANTRPSPSADGRSGSPAAVQVEEGAAPGSTEVRRALQHPNATPSPVPLRPSPGEETAPTPVSHDGASGLGSGRSASVPALPVAKLRSPPPGQAEGGGWRILAPVATPAGTSPTGAATPPTAPTEASRREPARPPPAHATHAQGEDLRDTIRQLQAEVEQLREGVRAPPAAEAPHSARADMDAFMARLQAAADAGAAAVNAGADQPSPQTPSPPRPVRQGRPLALISSAIAAGVAAGGGARAALLALDLDSSDSDTSQASLAASTPTFRGHPRGSYQESKSSGHPTSAVPPQRAWAGALSDSDSSASSLSFDETDYAYAARVAARALGGRARRDAADAAGEQWAHVRRADRVQPVSPAAPSRQNKYSVSTLFADALAQLDVEDAGEESSSSSDSSSHSASDGEDVQAQADAAIARAEAGRAAREAALRTARAGRATPPAERHSERQSSEAGASEAGAAEAVQGLPSQAARAYFERVMGDGAPEQRGAEPAPAASATSDTTSELDEWVRQYKQLGIANRERRKVWLEGARDQQPSGPPAAVLHQQILESLVAMDAMDATAEQLRDMQSARELSEAQAETAAVRGAWEAQAAAAEAAAAATTLQVQTEAELESRTAALTEEFEAAYARRMTELAAVAETAEAALAASRRRTGQVQTETPPRQVSVGVTADGPLQEAKAVLATRVAEARAAGKEWPPAMATTSVQASLPVDTTVGTQTQGEQDSSSTDTGGAGMQAPGSPLDTTPAAASQAPASLSPAALQVAYSAHAAALGSALAAYQRDPASLTASQAALLNQASRGALGDGYAVAFAGPERGADRAPLPPRYPGGAPPHPAGTHQRRHSQSVDSTGGYSGYSSDGFEEDYSAEFEDASVASSIHEGAMPGLHTSHATSVGEASALQARPVPDSPASQPDSQPSVVEDGSSLELGGSDESVPEEEAVVERSALDTSIPESPHVAPLGVSFAASPLGRQGGSLRGDAASVASSPGLGQSSYTYVSGGVPEVEESGSAAVGHSLVRAGSMGGSTVMSAYSQDFEEDEDGEEDEGGDWVAQGPPHSAITHAPGSADAAGLDFSLLDALAREGDAPPDLVAGFKGSLQARVASQMQMLDVTEAALRRRLTATVAGGAPPHLARLQFETEVAALVRDRASVRVQAYHDMVLFRAHVTGDPTMLKSLTLQDAQRPGTSVVSPGPAGSPPSTAPLALPQPATPPRTQAPTPAPSVQDSGRYTESFVSYGESSALQARPVPDSPASQPESQPSVVEDGSSLELGGSDESVPEEEGVVESPAPSTVKPGTPPASVVDDGSSLELGGSATSESVPDVVAGDAQADAAGAPTLHAASRSDLYASDVFETSLPSPEASGAVSGVYGEGDVSAAYSDSFVTAPSQAPAPAPPSPHTDSVVSSVAESLPSPDREITGQSVSTKYSDTWDAEDSGEATAHPPQPDAPPASPQPKPAEPLSPPTPAPADATLNMSVSASGVVDSLAASSQSAAELSASMAHHQARVADLRSQVQRKRGALAAVRRQVSQAENKVALRQEAAELEGELAELDVQLATEHSTLESLSRQLQESAQGGPVGAASPPSSPPHSPASSSGSEGVPEDSFPESLPESLPPTGEAEDSGHLLAAATGLGSSASSASGVSPRAGDVESSVDDLTESQDRIVLAPSPMHQVDITPANVTLRAQVFTQAGPLNLGRSSQACILHEADSAPTVFFPWADVAVRHLHPIPDPDGSQYSPYLGMFRWFALADGTPVVRVLPEPHEAAASLAGMAGFDPQLVAMVDVSSEAAAATAHSAATGAAVDALLDSMLTSAVQEAMMLRKKAEAERIAAEKAAAEKAEAERIAAEKAEAERIAAEKAEAERIAAEKAEAERIAAEKAEAEKAEAERIAAEKAEAERIAAEKAEAERIATEKAEAERIAAEKAEAERIAAEKAEAERIAAEKAEAERIAAEKAEAERIAAEKAEAEKAEAERIAAEKAEAERIAAEKAEAERIAAEKAEAERIAAEKAEAERIAAEKAEAERIAAEKAEAERIAAEKAEAERIAAEKAARNVASTRTGAAVDALVSGLVEEVMSATVSAAMQPETTPRINTSLVPEAADAEAEGGDFWTPTNSEGSSGGTSATITSPVHLQSPKMLGAQSPTAVVTPTYQDPADDISQRLLDAEMEAVAYDVLSTRRAKHAFKETTSNQESGDAAAPALPPTKLHVDTAEPDRASGSPLHSPSSTTSSHGHSPRGSEVEGYVSPATAAAARKNPMSLYISGNLSPASPEHHALSPSGDDAYVDDSFELEASGGEGDVSYDFEDLHATLESTAPVDLSATLKDKPKGSGALPPLKGVPASLGRDTTPGSQHGAGDSQADNPFVRAADRQASLAADWKGVTHAYVAEVCQHLQESTEAAAAGLDVSSSSAASTAPVLQEAGASWARSVMAWRPGTPRPASGPGEGPLPLDVFLFLEQGRTLDAQSRGEDVAALEPTQVRHKLLFDVANEWLAEEASMSQLRRHLATRGIMPHRQYAAADAASATWEWVAGCAPQLQEHLGATASSCAVRAPAFVPQDDPLKTYAKHGWVGPPLSGRAAHLRAAATARREAVKADTPLKAGSFAAVEGCHMLSYNIAEAVFAALVDEAVADVAKAELRKAGTA